MSGTDPQGTTLLGLYQSAPKLGFDTECMEAESVENLKTDVNGPVVLHVLIDSGPTGRRLQHYVVCYGWDATRQHFVIGDPARGVVTYRAEELTAIWPSRILLTLAPNANF